LALRERAEAFYFQGLTYAEIGAHLDLSRQRVQQLIRPPRAIYEAVKSRAEGKCEDCGVAIQGGHVHHKNDPGLDYNALENLLYLCASCHPKRHTDPLTAPTHPRPFGRISAAAAIMGRKGGQSRSLAKIEAVRRNAKLGGRPPTGNSKRRRARSRGKMRAVKP